MFITYYYLLVLKLLLFLLIGLGCGLVGELLVLAWGVFSGFPGVCFFGFFGVWICGFSGFRGNFVADRG